MLFAIAMQIAAPQVATVELLERRQAEQPAEPRRSPYRLDPEVEAPDDLKARAVQVDGGQCAVVGARLCTRKPRTVFKTDFSD